MPTIPVEVSVLERLLAQRDTLVRAITRAASTQEWEEVMAAFDGLLASLKELETRLTPDPQDVVRGAHEDS